jgi:1,4-dihydroxy-2-naphthoate octaprenyltransferase
MTLKQTLVVWFKAARAPFLVVSVVPALLGGAIAARHGPVDGVVFAVAVLGVVMAHSAADFIDDYFDFKSGNLGNKVKQFHDSPLIDGTVTLRQVAVATLACLAVAGAAAVYLVVRVGMPVLAMTAAGAFIVLFYTSPPLKLNYRGLGETALFLAFGPLIVVGVVYVLTGRLSAEALLAGVPLGIFTMNVGLVSNTFDYHDDVASGKRSLPVRFGQAAAVRIIAVTSVLAYLVTVAAALAGVLPIATLAMVLTLPLAARVVARARLHDDTANYTPAMTAAIALATTAGVVLCLAYVATMVLRPAP